MEAENERLVAGSLRYFNRKGYLLDRLCRFIKKSLFVPTKNFPAMRAFYLVLLLCILTFASSAQNKLIDQRLYSMQYDANWSIDSTDPDYNPDSYFAIDADENAVFILTIFEEELDLDELLMVFVKSFKGKLLENLKSEKDISSWGKYKGSGKLLNGESPGYPPLVVRIFCLTEAGRSYAMIIQMHEDDVEKHKAGFELIENSFSLKK